jgi:hypothetical protein
LNGPPGINGKLIKKNLYETILLTFFSGIPGAKGDSGIPGRDGGSGQPGLKGERGLNGYPGMFI